MPRFKHGILLSRKNSFIATNQTLAEYEKKTKRKIYFIDINQVFIDEFERWLLKTKKYAVNTSSKHIANIKNNL
ncbi:MAG: phage integrase SAM-like domain-containing protein [Flavobacterium sp.]